MWGWQAVTRKLIGQLKLGQDQTRVAVASYAGTKQAVLYDFDTHTIPAKASAAVTAQDVPVLGDNDKEKTPGISNALVWARQVLFTADKGVRSDAPNVVFLFVVGTFTSQAAAEQAAANAQILKNKPTAAIIYAIGINSNSNALVRLASPGDKEVNSYIAAAKVLLSVAPTDLLVSSSMCGQSSNVAVGCVGCSCFKPGSKSTVCNKATGTCTCKEFVEGKLCGLCKEGFSALDNANPVGCSGNPKELAAPTLLEVAGRKIKVEWNPPKVNGGPIVTYVVLRDDKTYVVIFDAHERTPAPLCVSVSLCALFGRVGFVW